MEIRNLNKQSANVNNTVDNCSPEHPKTSLLHSQKTPVQRLDSGILIAWFGVLLQQIELVIFII